MTNIDDIEVLPAVYCDGKTTVRWAGRKARPGELQVSHVDRAKGIVTIDIKPSQDTE